MMIDDPSTSAEQSEMTRRTRPALAAASSTQTAAVIVRRFAITVATATLFVAGAPMLGASVGAAPAIAPGAYRAAADSASVVETVQFVWLGHEYCWYDDGWQVPGWYWCGYADRQGFGWGGGFGWHGWRGGHRGGHNVHRGHGGAPLVRGGQGVAPFIRGGQVGPAGQSGPAAVRGGQGGTSGPASSGGASGGSRWRRRRRRWRRRWQQRSGPVATQTAINGGRLSWRPLRSFEEWTGCRHWRNPAVHRVTAIRQLSNENRKTGRRKRDPSACCKVFDIAQMVRHLVTMIYSAVSQSRPEPCEFRAGRSHKPASHGTFLLGPR